MGISLCLYAHGHAKSKGRTARRLGRTECGARGAGPLDSRLVRSPRPTFSHWRSGRSRPDESESAAGAPRAALALQPQVSLRPAPRRPPCAYLQHQILSTLHRPARSSSNVNFNLNCDPCSSALHSHWLNTIKSTFYIQIEQTLLSIVLHSYKIKIKPYELIS